MGYATKQEVIQILANAMTEGNPAGPGVAMPVTSIGHSITDTIPDEDIEQYIRWADSNIEAAISSVYVVPLKRINLGGFQLAMDVTAGAVYCILYDTTRFNPGDVVLVRNASTWQELTIDVVPSHSRLDFTGPISASYLAVDTKIERISYPDPIPKISAKLAAAMLYDKHFAAQQEGNQSEFGTKLRKASYAELNQVLSGAIRLSVSDGSRVRGRRYYNQALDDVFSTAAEASKTWINPEA
jgi:hypothetical protein